MNVSCMLILKTSKLNSTRSVKYIHIKFVLNDLLTLYFTYLRALVARNS